MRRTQKWFVSVGQTTFDMETSAGIYKRILNADPPGQQFIGLTMADLKVWLTKQGPYKLELYNA